MRRLGIRVLPIVMLAILAGCGKESVDTEKQDEKSSSEAVAEIRAVAEKYQTSLSEKDWETYFSCMDKKSQAMYVGMAISMARFSSGKNESKNKSLDELLKKHGIKQPPSGRPKIKFPLLGFDHAALMKDITAWSEKSGGSPVSRAKKTEFSDFKVDGDTGVATATTETGTQSEMYFKKVGEKWYVDLNTTMRKGMENMKRPKSRKKR